MTVEETVLTGRLALADGVEDVGIFATGFGVGGFGETLGGVGGGA